jgi:hypothetical protein
MMHPRGASRAAGRFAHISNQPFDIRISSHRRRCLTQAAVPLSETVLSDHAAFLGRLTSRLARSLANRSYANGLPRGDRSIQ